MADLTRFDFNAYDFLNSESVDAMSDAECGQYILLLAKSWVIAKDASLPDDNDALSRWAHCEKVSKKVLDKFPLVETQYGNRRQNSVLFNEWKKAQNRSAFATEIGKKGLISRWGNGVGDSVGDSVGNGVGQEKSMACTNSPNQAKPSQTKPNQTKPSQDCNFAIIATRYRAVMGRSHSKSKGFKDKYYEVCGQFGEDEILKQFDDWAESNKWRKESLGNTGLRFFFSDLPEMVSESEEVEKMKSSSVSLHTPTVQEETAIQESIKSSILKTHAELDAWDEQQKQEQIALEELKANPNAF